MTPRVAIVGCGLVGAKRAAALAGARLVVCADAVADRAQALASRFGAVACADWRAAVARSDVDVVIVATTNDSLASIAIAALDHGKHVLVEKPAGRNVAEIDGVADAAARNNRLVRVGFNHRHHPAIAKAQQLAAAGEIGELMIVRGRYGHGGRVGYEHEWRASRDKAGGGELVDQGVHLIDLARWLLGEFPSVTGFAHTFFWQMPVDDNAFLLLRTAGDRTALLHVSCTEWKNLFSLEVYGRTGKLHVEGLGGSYGLERLAFYRMRPEMGPPETTIWEFPGADGSWASEMAAFIEDVRLARTPSAGLADARAALEIVEQVYRQSA